jgi:hypothetical protein
MPHKLHPADCPCCAQRKPHPHDNRLSARCLSVALPLSIALWALIAITAHHLLAR